ncbi:hypothetical protein [Streptomyces bottropensis]|uniref:hypothetical protein n=1 Tax=Streptomyces bottropensis TaxID=42235 RepID=UPI00369E14BA
MARTPDTFGPSLRTRLAQASAKLTEAQAPALAAAVDEILAPGGWETLRHTDPARSEQMDRNLAMNIPKVVRDEIVKAVEADPEAASVTAVGNKGLVEYLAGRFQMPERSGTHGYGGERVNLNWRPMQSLRSQVEERGVSVARVAVEYLMSRYEIGPYAQGARVSLPRGADRIPSLPRVVRDAIRKAAGVQGDDRVDDVVNEGLQKFLDGDFVPLAPVWSQEAREDMAPFKIRPNDGLYEKAGVKAKALGLRASQVAIDYLLEEYGITEGIVPQSD